MAAGPATVKSMDAYQLRVTAGAIILSAIYAAAVMLIASPVSFYTMDDPYIHMALAENIARGHFGVNFGEASNPSSSILWPWLLAVSERVGVMLWAPLLINISCFVGSLNVALRFAEARLDRVGRERVLILVGLGFLAFNVFGVMFTGMEHSLHVLLTVLAVARVIDGKYDVTTLNALILAPLVRFEGAIILAFGVGAALVDRKWMFAAAAAGGAASLAGVYAWWLTGLGLPVLPSSVLSKSAASSSLVEGGGGMTDALLANFIKNIGSPAAPMLAVLMLGAVYAAVKRTGRDRVLALGAIAVLLLATMLGRMDSYARYEVYVLCAAGLALVHLLSAELKLVLGSITRTLVLGGGLCLVGALLGPYVLITTPQAARNIERQQYQMHRLVTECWKKPVAINDLGWVSVRNEQYVLDLYGLGNEEARKARAAAEPGWMKRLADAHDVELAMFYGQWFPDVPADWVRVGMIVDEERQVTPYANAVQVYATRPEAVEQVRACLKQIERSTGPAIIVAKYT